MCNLVLKRALISLLVIHLIWLPVFIGSI